MLTACSLKAAAQDQVCIKENCFNVEIAQTNQERAQGLMNRSSLEKDAGMLFIFTYRNSHRFWMKNTLIPLDMIWMDHARKIVHIEENVPPCEKDPCPTYGPNERNALYVLEINAGLVKTLNIKLNDTVQFKLLNE